MVRGRHLQDGNFFGVCGAIPDTMGVCPVVGCQVCVSGGDVRTAHSGSASSRVPPVLVGDGAAEEAAAVPTAEDAAAFLAAFRHQVQQRLEALGRTFPQGQPAPDGPPGPWVLQL